MAYTRVSFVNISYHPFNASNWRIEPAGLLAPIQLIPMAHLQPR